MPRVVVVVVIVLLVSTLASAQPVHTAPSQVPPPAAPTPRHRLSVHGHFGVGRFMHAGGSLRYQLHNLLLRLGLVRGFWVEDEGDGFDAALLQFGGVTGGRLYLFGEVGGIVIRTRRSVDDTGPYGPSWHALPSATAGLGMTLGSTVDLGIAGWYPLAGVGLYLGLDLHEW